MAPHRVSTRLNRPEKSEMSERNGEERKSKTAIVFRLRTHHLLCFFLYFRRVFFLLVGVHLVLFIFSCLFHRCWEEEAHERQKKNINLLVVDDRPPKRAPSITVASFRLRDSFVTQLARAGHRISFFYLFFFLGGGFLFFSSIGRRSHAAIECGFHRLFFIRRCRPLKSQSRSVQASHSLT